MTETIEKEKATVSCPTEAELQELGFTVAAAKVKTDKAMARKLRIAFEHFRVVSIEAMTQFMQEVASATKRIGLDGKELQPHELDPYTKYTRISRMANMCNSEEYPGVPPTEVLEKVRKAKKLGCFDYFHVLTVTEQSHYVPDPIIFGRISGSTDYFFVAQWDDDVSIDEIIAPEEGWKV